MNLSEKNKDAIKSSVLVGVAFGLFWLAVTQSVWVGVGFFFFGIICGLLTTWYCDEDK